MKITLLFVQIALFLALVSAGQGQPVITNPPQTQATAPGTAVSFTVGASGAEPLAYQWQRNPGTGFADFAARTNAVLVLTDVQPWDALDYRVIVTDLSGARTSTVAHLYVMSPGLLTSAVVLDNFDDNIVTGWVWGGSGIQFPFIESSKQFTIRGKWPGLVTRRPYDTWDWP